MRRLTLAVFVALLTVTGAAGQTFDATNITTLKGAASDWLAADKAAAGYTPRTTAATRAANALKTSTAAAALLAGAKVLLAPPIAPTPPVSGVLVHDAAGLNAALRSAPAASTILLAPGPYDGAYIDGITTGGLTITSADPAHPGVFSRFYITNSKGLAFTRVTFSTEGSTDPYPFRVGYSSDISFDHISVHGSMNGNPQDDVTGLWIGNHSDNIRVTSSEFQELLNGLTQGNATNILIDGNHIHDVGSDGIDNAGSSNVTISNNWIADLHPADGQHPDAIQFFTSGATQPVQNVTVTGNLYERGTGLAGQGVFIGDEAGVGYKGVTANDNLLVGALYNGLALGAGDTVTLNRNKVLQWDDQPSWVVLRGGMSNVTANDNQASRFAYNDGIAPAGSGNVVVSAPADKGAGAIAAWHAAHPGVK